MKLLAEEGTGQRGRYEYKMAQSPRPLDIIQDDAWKHRSGDLCSPLTRWRQDCIRKIGCISYMVRIRGEAGAKWQSHAHRADPMNGVASEKRRSQNSGTRTTRCQCSHVYLAFQPNKRRPPRSYPSPPRHQSSRNRSLYILRLPL